LAVLAAVLIVVLVRYRRSEAARTEALQSEEVVRRQFNAALESIVEIQDSLNAAIPQENRLVELSRDAEMRSSVTRTQREQMLATISDLKRSVEASKQRIRELEKSLDESQVRVAGLLRVVENLKRSVAEKEASIRRYTARVDSLRVTVAGLQVEVQRGQQQIEVQKSVIEEKSREINTVYYIVDTKRELKEKGIIIETGGVLGMGKTVRLSGTFNQNYFSPLDTDQVTEIAIHGTQPQVLSGQARSSYGIVTMVNGQNWLAIKDPREFRKVKYLVVMVRERD